MPLKKLTTLEKNQIDNDIKNLEEKKNYFQKLLNERELLLKLLIKELLILKKKYNVIRKTKVIKNINQNEELETLNNQILEEFINKKTKLCIDNRLYLKKMILNHYKKSFEVVNKIIDKPIKNQGITNHRVYGHWICGGASNAGCGILSQFFSDLEIKELSRQINPSKNTSLNLLPLNSKGERFPINDSNLEPILGPRPVSDSLYLHALFEGLAKIELKGWEKLGELTGSLPKKIITIGGGSKNPQWRKKREKIINIPIVSCKKTTSFGTALLAINSK